MTEQKAYAIVTGASSGIGYQYARILAEKGYNLLIISNVEDELAEKKKQLEQDFPVEIKALTRNLGIPEAAKELYDWCKTQNIEVEVLINIEKPDTLCFGVSTDPHFTGHTHESEWFSACDFKVERIKN